ncbi:site-specific DNA-methyltransferase [Glaesserella parasuis]|nr:site-specific DNA-methyltransferase [Glaesserella parasuis]
MLKKQTMRGGGGGKPCLNSNGYDDLQHLVVDTSLFSATFQSALISELSRSLGDFDSHINGTLIHSDNFQALNLLQARYREQVKCIYIDPPYNTEDDRAKGKFIYKDGYPSSTWASLIHSRLLLAKPLLNQAGVLFQSIDDNEQANLKFISNSILGSENFIACLPTIMNLKGNNDEFGFSGTHEYTLVWTKNKNSLDDLNGIQLTDEDILEYSEYDELGQYKQGATLMRTGEAGERIHRPKGYYPIYVSKDLTRLSVERLSADDYEIFPRSKNGKDMSWRRSPEKLSQTSNEFIIKQTRHGISFYKKQRLQDDLAAGKKAKSLFYKPEYSSSNGTGLLKSLFIDRIFNNPKPISLISDFIRIGAEINSLILDYFAGSGTTAHAVINLNREDKGNRQYILVEQGEYFDTVLKPRVQKVIYSKAWKEGKPVVEDGAENLQGVPQIVKVLKLESYEDTLNNLELRHSGLFDNLSDDVQQDYLLHYMLNLESRGSLLNVSHFEKPFDYGLNISTTSAGAYEWQKVDLVETFNYLIGARLVSIDDQRVKRGYVAIDCQLPNQSGDDKTLIIWRDCEQWHYENLYAEKEFSHNFQDSKTTLFGKMNFNPKNTDYAQVYINGDHTLETVWDGEQSGSLKIISIEDAFLSLMFEGDA